LPGSAISRRPGFTAIAPAAGSTNNRICIRQARADHPLVAGDDVTPPRPGRPRSIERLSTERAWQALGLQGGAAVDIFRLPGIYGPGRSAIDQVKAGTARRIDKPGQVFSRIHVDDLASVLIASIKRPRPGAVYNVCDDEPAAPEAVVAHAASLLRLPPPPLVPFDEAALSPLARSFWDDNKRVANALITTELGVVLRYPSYREGLAAILAASPDSGQATNRRQKPSS